MSLKSPSKKGLFSVHTNAYLPRLQGTPKTSRAEVISGIVPFIEAVCIARAAKARGAKVVTTNGCFDLLHIGHVRYLKWAKRQGDILIVGVNSDASVRRLKGPSRPMTPEKERAEILAALRAVDAVFIFKETTPERWLKKLKPNVHVKGGDRAMEEIVEKRVVEDGGGRVILAPHTKSRSTTRLLKRFKLRPR